MTKKLMQTYIVIVSGSILNVSTVHLNGICNLSYNYLSKPILSGHPVLSGHRSISQGCPLNTGFTVLCRSCVQCIITTSQTMYHEAVCLSLFSSKQCIIKQLLDSGLELPGIIKVFAT